MGAATDVSLTLRHQLLRSFFLMNAVARCSPPWVQGILASPPASIGSLVHHGRAAVAVRFP